MFNLFLRKGHIGLVLYDFKATAVPSYEMRSHGKVGQNGATVSTPRMAPAEDGSATQKDFAPL